MIDDLERLRAVLFRNKEFNEEEFFSDGIRLGMFMAVNDIDEFGNLEDDLLKTRGVSTDADGHAGELSIASLGNNEGVDIVSSAGKDLADAHEDTRFVVNKNREGVNGVMGYADFLGIGVRCGDRHWFEKLNFRDEEEAF